MTIVELFSKILNKSTSDISNFLAGASKKYKIYSIPKRTHGRRTIAQPSKDLKVYQRIFLEHYRLPAHARAMAYQKGLSIKDNANQHRNQCYLLKMDLDNFFNSIDNNLFWEIIKNYNIEIENEKEIIDQLIFWSPSKKTDGKLILSVGAPTSPMISNFCMYKFDIIIDSFCKERNIIYTRYADDLTFSTNHNKTLNQVPSKIRSTLYELFGNKITINHAKTVFSSKAHNRHVTGITLSNDNSLSLGRKKKRYIKHLIHKFSTKSLSDKDIKHLKGLLSHASHIEPSFIQSLSKKYGTSLLSEIKDI